MKLKQITAILLAILLTAALTVCAAGCKKNKKTEPTETTEAAADETTTAGEQTEAPAEPDTTAAAQPAAYAGVDPLTGLGGYDDGRYRDVKPVAIVVENHPGARPQWGMSTPDVIFEYEVEGGISRMLWLYSNPDEVPEKVGPVRSLRHDIYELALGYGAMLLHCGSSNIAREMFPTYAGLNCRYDLNTSEAICYRDKTRNVATEHTLVLLGDKLRDFLVSQGFDMTLRDEYRNPFLFAAADRPFVLTSGTCTSLHYEFSAYYTYTLAYNEATMLYDLNINGSPRTDADGVQCSYKNAVILYVDMVSMNDSAGHQDLLFENGGSGVYATNGTCMDVTWRKDGLTTMLKIYGPDGNELTLNAGNTYIGLVRSSQSGRTVIG